MELGSVFPGTWLLKGEVNTWMKTDALLGGEKEWQMIRRQMKNVYYIF